MQHVDALDDQDVGLVDLGPLVRHDVVSQMRIDRRAHMAAAGLDVGEKAEQQRQVVALRKTLLLHDALPLQHGVGIQKSVGGDQLDLGTRRPARQQRLKHAGRGGFSNRHRTGDADDVGHLAVADVEELALRVIEPLHGIDIDRQQARQWQVDVLDFLEIEPVVQRAQAIELARLQGHRRVVAQPRPLLARIDAVRIILLLGCADIHDAIFPPRLVAALARRLLFQP
ncbi:hypothetical protein ACVWWR_003146 [Bradyrhizobium sp. LM3.2]